MNLLSHYLPDEKTTECTVDSEDVTKTEETKTAIKGTSPKERFPYLNTESGMMYCMNNEDFYYSVIETFYHEDKRELLEKEFASEAWHDYQVHMHSLKSTSLTIGADELAEHAKAIELATKEGNIPFVKEHHKEVMQEYDALMEQLRREI